MLGFGKVYLCRGILQMRCRLFGEINSALSFLEFGSVSVAPVDRIGRCRKEYGRSG